MDRRLRAGVDHLLCEVHTLMPWCSIGTWHFHRPTARRVRTPVHERRRTEAPSRGDTAVGGFNQRSHAKKPREKGRSRPAQAGMPRGQGTHRAHYVVHT